MPVTRDAAALARAKLASSGLTSADGHDLGIDLVTAGDLDPKWPAVPALQLVYHDLGGKRRNDTYRVRLLEAPPSTFGEVREIRYLQPANTPPAVYLPTGIDAPAGAVVWGDIAADASCSVIVTEGELKAACATKHLAPTLGLGGVSSWRTAKLGWGLLPELEAFAWRGRDVVICFDSDAATNPDVAAATAALVAELRARGARCRVAELPAVEGLEKTGLDDFLVTQGAAAFEAVLEHAKGDELTQRLWSLNSRYCFVRDPGIIYDEEGDARYKPSTWKDAIAANEWAHEHVATPDGGHKIKRVRVAPAWVEWSARREAARFTYAPGKARFIGEQVNEWRGWGVEPKKGSIAPWTELLDRLFDGEPAARTWFERWCLYPIKYPGAKLLTACGLWSVAEGVGKTAVPVTLGRIYGKNFVQVTQAQLESNFNGWAARRQLVLVDDVSAHDSRSKADVLKSLITEEELLVNIKQIPEYTVPDVCNWVLTSNKPNAFYVEDRDRRWFLHEVRAEPDLKFFKKFWAWAGNPLAGTWPGAPGPAALFWHAREVADLGDFDPHAPAPMTRSKEAMVERVKTELDQWLTELVRDPDAKLRTLPAPVERDLLTARELAQLFNAVKIGQGATAAYVGSRAPSYLASACGGALVRAEESGEAERFYVVRGAERWRAAKPAAVAAHVRDGRERERAARPGRRA